jgi:putative oxidoreductase
MKPTVGGSSTERAGTGIRTAIAAVIRGLDSVPYSWLAVPLRAAAATVFWRSGTAKLANWNATLFLFEDEYQLPLIPPELAAQAALVIELVAPTLLILGLATRGAAAVLLAMTAVIQIFVYPGAWPTHIQWAAILLVLLCRGAGGLSLDAVIAPRLLRPDRT